MSKRQNATRENVLTWIARGDGQGVGASFRPFLHVRDVPSRGRSSMDNGFKTGRTHHYLSDVEYGYHLLAEFSADVVDIREQYALLPWEETQEIAESLGIKHPIYQGTGVPRVLTSDLVLTMTSGLQPPHIVISGKVTADIDIANPEAKRTLEKLLIEMTYWGRRDVKWVLGTEKMLPVNKVFNLGFFRTSMVSRELDWLNPQIGPFLRAFAKIWTPQASLNALLNDIAADLNLKVEHVFTLMGRSIWTRELEVDLNKAQFAHESPVPMLSTFATKAETQETMTD
jgi:TnsA endonuclease N terminal